MRPKERRESGQRDLFRARLDQIVDMWHPLAKLARTVDWGFLERSFGAVYADVPGRPPLPTRLQCSFDRTGRRITKFIVNAAQSDGVLKSDALDEKTHEATRRRGR